MNQALHDEILQRLERIERISTIAAKSVLNIEETALLTGYTTKYLYRLVHDRAIPPQQVGQSPLLRQARARALATARPTRDQGGAQGGDSQAPRGASDAHAPSRPRHNQIANK